VKRAIAFVSFALTLAFSAAAIAQSVVEAVKSGDRATTLALLDQRADANAAESDGTTALHWAVHRDDLELVERLIKAGANVKAVNQYGATPMSEAAVVGNVKVLEKLLKAGADPDSANADGQTPLMVVARTSNVAAAQLLLRRGADVNAKEQWREQTALMWAVAQSQSAMVKELIARGADVNARSAVNQWKRQVTAEPRVKAMPSGGFTPLLYAARQGCLECAKLLVKGKADLDLGDPDGVSPLLLAILNAHFDVAAYLLEQGANPNKWDWWGRAPLYAAVDYNTIPHGGRPDQVSLDATSSLKMIELLLQAGANPNAQLKLYPPYRSLGADRGADTYLTIGATPILRAAKAGDAAAIRLLLQYRANPNLPTLQGITPLMAAAGLRYSSIDTRGRFTTESEALEGARLLVEAGADVNAGDRVRQTALHGAAFRGWNDMIKLLAANHAKIDAADAQGVTALDVAMGRGGRGRGNAGAEAHEDTAALLKELLAGTSAATAAK
jgi:uncharacterized protein